MNTNYHVIQVDGSVSSSSVDWPREPGYDRIKALVEPLLGKDEPLEHVSVLQHGKRADMFVSEYGHMQLTTRDPLPINPKATAIYRNNWLTQHPEADPAALPDIAGVAVLFERIVWF